MCICICKYERMYHAQRQWLKTWRQSNVGVVFKLQNTSTLLEDQKVRGNSRFRWLCCSSQLLSGRKGRIWSVGEEREGSRQRAALERGRAPNPRTPSTISPKLPRNFHTTGTLVLKDTHRDQFRACHRVSSRPRPGPLMPRVS